MTPASPGTDKHAGGDVRQTSVCRWLIAELLIATN